MATKEQINSNYIECNIKPSKPNNKYLGIFYGNDSCGDVITWLLEFNRYALQVA